VLGGAPTGGHFGGFLPWDTSARGHVPWVLLNLSVVRGCSPCCVKAEAADVDRSTRSRDASTGAGADTVIRKPLLNS